MRTVRIGAGAGFAGDRIEPAVELAEKADLDYLVFECLAERTIALAQQARQRDENAGYDPRLKERMAAVLRPCATRGVRIVTNMGAANPVSAARAIADLARQMGLHGLTVAAVTGDDVTALIRELDLPLIDRAERSSDLSDRIVSANAYLGAAPVIEALRNKADIVVTGRVGDAAMFLAPLAHEFDWPMQDWDRLGKGTVVGHLLECAGQVSGGYFADPGYKDVPDPARIGFPFAEVRADGSALIGKVPGSGGRIDLMTCKEQLLYEVHDPARYYQPDVVADFTTVRFAQKNRDAVLVSGGGGTPRTGTLKVSIGYLDSYVGEGQISYAGAGALARAQLALRIVEERLALTGVKCRELRLELIGVNAVHRGAKPEPVAEPPEVRIRAVGRTDSMQEAVRVGQEVEMLYTNGPAGGGGAWTSAREILAVASALIPRDRVETQISYATT